MNVVVASVLTLLKVAMISEASAPESGNRD